MILLWLMTLQEVRLILFLPVPLPESPNDVFYPKLLVASALTPSQTRKQSQEVNLTDSLLASVFPGNDPPSSNEVASNGDTEPEMQPETSSIVPPTHKAFTTAQKGYPSLASSVVHFCTTEPFFVGVMVY